MFNLGFLAKDQNQSPSLFNYLFQYSNKIEFVNTELYTGNTSNFTYLFLDNDDVLDTRFLSFSLSGNEPVSASALTQSIVL